MCWISLSDSRAGVCNRSGSSHQSRGALVLSLWKPHMQANNGEPVFPHPDPEQGAQWWLPVPPSAQLPAGSANNGVTLYQLWALQCWEGTPHFPWMRKPSAGAKQPRLDLGAVQRPLQSAFGTMTLFRQESLIKEYIFESIPIQRSECLAWIHIAENQEIQKCLTHLNPHIIWCPVEG